MTSAIQFFIFVIVINLTKAFTDVSNLVGQSDFRSIILQWRYSRGKLPDRETEDFSPKGFLVTYCEDQAWGKYRCRKKLLDDLSKNEVREENGQGVYQTTLDRLRMATNYTVEVSPFFDGEGGVPNFNERGRSIGTHIKIQTKGFSARAIRCLANSSLVEIETGPYFGGMISVEGTTNKKCSTQGDYSDPKTSYFLKIDHRVCGSNLFNNSVKTFIIVQESLPILTHSTRRFMVLCKYSPETFTVRAGVNLPYDDNDGSAANDLVPVDEDVVEVDPSELFDSTNFFGVSSRDSSRASKQVGRALRFSTDLEEKAEEPRRLSHFVLVALMVVAATVGLVLALWQFVFRMRKTGSRTSGLVASQSGSSSISTEPSLGGYEDPLGETGDESGTIHPHRPPPVGLVSVRENSVASAPPDPS